MTKKNKFRKPILNQYKRIWLDEEGHSALRELKSQHKKSMAQIVKDLIIGEYKNLSIKFKNYGKRKAIRNVRESGNRSAKGGK